MLAEYETAGAYLKTIDGTNAPQESGVFNSLLGDFEILSIQVII